jgi:serine/threonine protein phosphatase PrpC
MVLTPPAKQKCMDVLHDAEIACCVIKGDKYGDWSQGQDNISISLICGGWEVFCVADGHGSVGHWVATHTVRGVPKFLSSEACQAQLQAGDVRGSLLEAFRMTQADLVTEARKDAFVDKLSQSGATFACILKDPDHKSVWLAHLGDMRAIMFSPEAVLLQTDDHNVKVQAELRRIQDHGCEVRERRYEDGFSSCRIYVKGMDYPGIMMTRCFGDLCVKDFGIIAEPEINHWQGTCGALSSAADANECYILCASDGIWEMLDTQTVHAMVSEHLREGKSLQDACRHLVEQAKMRWSSSEPNYCDDISVVVLPLTGKSLPPVEPLAVSEGCFGACAKCSIL